MHAHAGVIRYPRVVAGVGLFEEIGPPDSSRARWAFCAPWASARSPDDSIGTRSHRVMFSQRRECASPHLTAC
eukprot:4573927-Alexandrium_andersonii.AAC.1